MSTLESHESYGEDEFKEELDSLGKSVKPEKQGNIENTGDYIKNYVQNIIEECVAFDPLSLPLNLSYIKESIVNYIVDWKLNSNENGELEAQIKKLSENLMNWKLKYLIDNSYKPLINIIQDIKKDEEKRRQNLLNSMPTDKKETIKKWWDEKYTFGHNLTESQKGTITNVLTWWKSPVTVKMVTDSCKRAKNVPVEYLLGFMQNDSRVWTMWRWARTHNPWNVWNTSKWTKDWWTWEKWVEACASNLEKRINSYTTKINEIKEEFKKYLGEHFNEQKFDSIFNSFPTPEQLATWTLTWTFAKTGKIDNNREILKNKILKAFPNLRNIPNFKSKKIEERAKESFPLIKTLVHGWSVAQSYQSKTLSTPIWGFNRFFWIYMWAPNGPSKVAWIIKTWVDKLRRK